MSALLFCLFFGNAFAVLYRLIEKSFIAFLYANIVALIAAFLLNLSFNADDKRRDAREAAWVSWKANKAAQGCKVTSFVSQKYSTREVWTCPDGHAELGQKQ